MVGLIEGPTRSYTRIMTRPSSDGLFSRQMLLNNLLDFAINLPSDESYAISMLFDYDLYEDEDGGF